MAVLQTLTSDMKDAMRSGDKRSLEAIRYLMAQVKNAQIDKPDHSDLTEVEFQQILRKVMKNTQEAIEQYSSGGREDLVEEETQKLEFMKKYLPQQLTDEQLKALVEKIISENPDLGVGPLTGKVMQAAAGKTDGSRVAQVIQQLSS